MHKKIFAACFILLCSVVFFESARAFQKSETNIFAVEDKESALENVFPFKDSVREIYGMSNQLLSPNEVAKSSGSIIVKDEDGFLQAIGVSSFDIDIAKQKLSKLQQVCQESGAEFVYVSYPSKANPDDSKLYGIDTNKLENREELLAYAEEQGINYLNVGALFASDGYTTKDLFYKTDHHWKSTAGLYAARAIANHLNDTLGYSLRADLLKEDQFSFTTYENLWFGETGRALSLRYVDALDDFTQIKPNYDTSIRIQQANGDCTEGDFSIMIDDSKYSGENVNLYSYSAHYSYENSIYLPTHYHNNNVKGPKILLIKDSYSVVVVPFLSLATADLIVWDIRSVRDSLYDYIRQNDFDAVLLAYTDFWSDYMWEFR